MADYNPTVFLKDGEDNETAHSWNEHWELIWRGYHPDGSQHPTKSRDEVAASLADLDAVVALIGTSGGGGGLSEAQVNDLIATALAGIDTGMTEAEVGALVDGRIQTLVGTAPANLDTLQEISAALAADDDAVAALTSTIAGKATQADLDTLSALVDTKASASDLAAKANASDLAAKADQAALDALEVTVGTKADAATLAEKADAAAVDALATTVGTKADQEALDALSAEVDAIDIPEAGPAGAPTALPSYAPATAANRYDPVSNVYNVKGSNSRHVHAGIARALGGGKMNILAIGDSALIGYNGTDTKESRAIPRLVGRIMTQSLGTVQAGSGLVVPAGAAGIYPTDRFAITGNVVMGSGTATMYAGSSITFTSEQAGTTGEVYYSDASAAFAVSIDGGAAVTVTPGGTSTIKRYQVTGLTDAVHSIKVTAPTSYVFLEAMATQRAAGIAVHNIAWGGARAAQGGPGVAWLDTSQASNIQVHRKGAFDQSGITPDLVLWSLGGNDVANGTTPEQFATSFATLKGWYPNSDHMLMTGPGLSTAPQATWDAFVASLYSLCDTLNIAMLELRDRCGYATEASALGYIGADGFHPTQGAAYDWARLIVNAYTGSGPGPVYVAPVGGVTVGDLGEGTVLTEWTP